MDSTSVPPNPNRRSPHGAYDRQPIESATGVDGGADPAASKGVKLPVPPEILAMKWNWGAVLVSPFWYFSHGLGWWFVGWFVAATVTGGILAPGLWVLPIFINRFAWQNRRFDSVEHYKAVQRVWAVWALIVAAPVLLLTGFVISWLISTYLHGDFGRIPFGG